MHTGIALLFILSNSFFFYFGWRMAKEDKNIKDYDKFLEWGEDDRKKS